MTLFWFTILPYKVSPKNHKYVFVLVFKSECKSIEEATSAPKNGELIPNLLVNSLSWLELNDKVILFPWGIRFNAFKAHGDNVLLLQHAPFTLDFYLLFITNG